MVITNTHSNLLSGKKVAIVGGGMAGLTLARLLQLKDVDVTLYERDFGPGARVQGSTLDLHEGTGLEAMRRAGLLAGFYEHHRKQASKMLIVDRSLNVRFDDHEFSEFTSETRPEIDRGPLRDLLLNSLKPNTVVWDRSFSSLEKEGSGWCITFKNGSSASADFVIAADGANSKIRPYLTSIAPIYSGITLIQVDTDHANLNLPKLTSLARGGKIMAFDDEKMIGFGTKGDGSSMAVICFKCPEPWASENRGAFDETANILEWFKGEFSRWSDRWHELVLAPESRFTLRPQSYFPLDQTWQAQENLTMIGDAAHWMPPFAGEGANVAMQDSFELAEVLTSGEFSDVLSAVSHFEADMVRRGASATQETLANAQKMFAKDGLEQMLGFFNQVGK